MKDYYSILGVPKEADGELIKAIYLALSKIYHPDVYKGAKNFAEKRMKEINQAYETLSDPIKKKAYDDLNKTDDNSSFEDDDFNDEQFNYQEIIKDKWIFAKEYYPRIEELYNDLVQLNKKLAWQFQILCVETKSFDIADKIAKKIKKEWIVKYFGKNKDIQFIALKAIGENQVEIAKELNKAIKLLGDNSQKIIIEKLREKFPEFFGINQASLETGYKGYKYIELRYFSGDTTWKITDAPQEASIGMGFDDEEKLKHYVDFNESL